MCLPEIGLIASGFWTVAEMRFIAPPFRGRRFN
jgi:hypothetical protein